MKDSLKFREGDALLIVDIQKDFCPGGALPVEDGDKILPVVNDWIDRARRENIPVYLSRDWHPEGHISFAEEGGDWPTHCLQDSEGAGFHPDLKVAQGDIVVTKGTRFDHDQNSAFDKTGLEVHLRNRGIRRLFLCGLALDVCVRASAMDALREKLEVVLITDGTRAVKPQDASKVMAQMQNAGVLLTDPSRARDAGLSEPEVCVKAPEWAEHERLRDADMPCDDGRSG